VPVELPIFIVVFIIYKICQL